MVERNDFPEGLGKSERGMEKAMAISAQPVSDFEPARISVELTPTEVQALNVLYNTINPEVAPDMKTLARYMLSRGMGMAFSEVRAILEIHKVLGELPPELRDLFEGFGKGGPQI